MKIALIVVVVLLALVGAVLVIGSLLPKGHRVSRAMLLKRTPGEVFAVVSNVGNGATWRAGVKSVEVKTVDGRLQYREDSSDGVINYEVVESLPPTLFVTRIADPDLPFGGTWTIRLQPAPQGTNISITEDGEVRNIVFRFVSRFILGHTKSIDRYLASLAAKFGEAADANIPR
jgi:Polyketide cyclase / dehydrase and lipid transport